MANFYHVFLKPKSGVRREAIEKTMDLCIDWCRYNDNCYVVYSSSDIPKLNERFKNHVRPDGGLLICKCDIKGVRGWLPKEIWPWFQKKR
jgi:hypothetical protein